MAIRVFVAFAQRDINVVRRLFRQLENASGDFAFDEYLPQEPFEEKKADYTGRRALAKLKGASVAMCMWSYKSARDAWVQWEVTKAREMGRPVLGVQIPLEGPTRRPRWLKDVPIVTWDPSRVASTLRELAAKVK
jgi:MTH538 TIR-like domain (DUF1863)